MPAALATIRTEPLDELTLRRAQRGDDRAWRALVERYQAPVHALIWRLLAGRSRHRVEDLVQETFVRVLRALPSWDLAGPASLQTWILTIATRLTLNELRKPEMTTIIGDPPATDSTDAASERARIAAAIAAGVATLPDAQRAVFVLREYHELEYADISEALGLDLGTVKSRLARARQALRERLVAELPELWRRR
ncbi:MAG: sigma-70 family RNA polymerase sigma factor [Myxococcota bacterium]|nr:sigma-70 family RNA polymerase sigma factor [Deltaproteobacteria bacterium]MDQ3340543.1 sigma-70 family RNA polymerase sigma factor [Myxococcota bacterium]